MRNGCIKTAVHLISGFCTDAIARAQSTETIFVAVKYAAPMRPLYLLLLTLFSLQVVAQIEGARPAATAALEFSTTRAAATPTFSFCDTNSDGFLPIDLDQIKNQVLTQYGGGLGSGDGIYLSTRLARVHLVTGINTTPHKTQVCSGVATTGGFGMLDIAVNQNGQLFVAALDKVYQINNHCAAVQMHDFGLNGASITSLSFDRNQNLYLGGFDASVYQLAGGDFENMNLWHNFGQGAAAGDFVMCRDKMYIAWRLGNQCRLYEVTVDAANNYVSHVDLGALPDHTFGLASEMGQLYGVTPQQLYHIDPATLHFNLILQNDNPLDDWYGAAGKNEAVTFEVSVYDSMAHAHAQTNALPAIWTNTIAFGQPVYVVVRNQFTGQQITVEVQLEVNVAPVNQGPTVVTHCVSDAQASVFDLDALLPQILGSQDASATFHLSASDAQSGVNAVSGLHTVSGFQQQLFIRMTHNVTGCTGFSSIELRITPSPEFHQPKDLVVCAQNASFEVDFSAQLAVILAGQPDDVHASFHTSVQDAQSGQNLLQAPYHFNSGTTVVFVRLENAASGCFTTGSFNVVVRAENQDVPVRYQVDTQDWSADENIVSVVSNGNYEFSMDGSHYQDSPVFDGLNAGEHQIKVRDKDHCSVDVREVFLLMYPRFFTPNGDGYNDVWNILLSANEPSMQVKVYDRYGALLTSFDGRSAGWNGQIAGRDLPASDYWFTVIRENGKEFKGHFTLKR